MGSLSPREACYFDELAKVIKLIKITKNTDKATMKVDLKVFLFIFCMLILSDARPVFAANERNCDNINHPAYQDEYRACLRANVAIRAKEAGVDCIECTHEQESSASDLVQALSAVAQPLAYLAGTYTVAKYQHESQKKWAEAYASGFQQCTNRFNAFLNYNTTIGANPLTAAEANSMSMSCNGYGYGSYAGYGGMMGSQFGTFGNPFQANGFSTGFMSGYGGPFVGGMGNIYGNGMMSGSIGISGYIGTTGSTSSNYSTGITPAFGF